VLARHRQGAIHHAFDRSGGARTLELGLVGVFNMSVRLDFAALAARGMRPDAARQMVTRRLDQALRAAPFDGHENDSPWAVQSS
jgi:hypothetical protein